MKYISTYRNPSGRLRVCKSGVCVEAQGDNAKLIAGAIAIAFVCLGVAALMRAS